MSVEGVRGICEVNKFNEIFSQSSESKILGRVGKCFHVEIYQVLP